MNEQEAVEQIERIRKLLGTIGETEDYTEVAIKALEEIQRYRAIGKPKEIKQKLEELERWHTYRLAINVKNPFAKMSTSICHNCDHKDDYIEGLEAEVEEYRKIGTIEECRAAVDVKKKITEIVNRQLIAGKNNYKETNDCFYEIVKVIQDNY